METIVDLLEDAAARFADRNALGLRMDDGTTWHWSYAELLRRSRIAAWRLRALGLQPGDRVLTWSPSTPALPAAYFGAMYAGLVFVPLDARMAPDTVAQHRRSRRAPSACSSAAAATPPTRARSARALPDDDRGRPVRRPGRHVPARLGGAARGLGAPEAVGRLRARVHVGHDRQPEGRDPHPRQRARGRDVVPRDHQPDGAPDRVAAPAVARARAGGLAVLRAQRRRRRPVRPEPEPAGHLRLRCASTASRAWSSSPRCSTCSGARSSARSRSRAGRRRSPGCGRSPGACRTRRRRLAVPQRPRAVRRRPAPVRDRRRVPAARAPAGVGGHGRHRAPGLRRDRDRRRRRDDDERPPAGLRGLAAEAASRCGSSRTARSSSAARASSRATGTTRRRRRPRSPRTAGTCPATSARSTRRAGSTSTGARRTSSSCPTASTCTPRTSRTRCGSPGSGTRWRSRRRPGRIEAVVLAPGTHAVPGDPRATPAIEAASPEDVRRQIDAAVKAANGSLGPNQRIAGWRLWPEADFPRTHTFKVKRDRVRAWAAIERAAAGDGRGARSRPGGRPAQGAVTGSPIVRERSTPRRAISGSGDTERRPREEHERRADAAEHELRVARVLDRARARAEVGGEVLARRRSASPLRRQLVDHDVALVGVRREDGLDDAPRDADQRRALAGPVRGLGVGDLEARRRSSALVDEVVGVLGGLRRWARSWPPGRRRRRRCRAPGRRSARPRPASPPMPMTANQSGGPPRRSPSASPGRRHPGGQVIGRPPSRWRWRWSTDWPPSRPDVA